jgi:hypothetical protein
MSGLVIAVAHSLGNYALQMAPSYLGHAKLQFRRSVSGVSGVIRADGVYYLLAQYLALCFFISFYFLFYSFLLHFLAYSSSHLYSFLGLNSRFSSESQSRQRAHHVYLRFHRSHRLQDSHFYCTCKAGSRTIGVQLLIISLLLVSHSEGGCSHIVAILYFFSFKLSNKAMPEATPLALERMASVTNISDFSKRIRRENAEEKKENALLQLANAIDDESSTGMSLEEDDEDGT